MLLGNPDGYELQDASGISQRVDDVLGGQFAHKQGQVAFEGCLEGAWINPLHVFRSTSTTNHFHHKFCVLHCLLCCLEVLLRRSRNTDEKGSAARRATGFQLRVNNTSLHCLDEIRLRIGSGNHALSIDNRRESNQGKLAFCMRKRLITPAPETVRSRGERWLDVERVATVEITSEDNDFPVESAFVSGEAQGWRAATAGTQTIRLVFDQPQKLKRISLVFEEKEVARTQEFVLRWSSDGGSSFREIVRQQWNFSPPETIREVEEYQVELSNVTILELTIVPNTSGGTAHASLKNLRLS